MGGLAGAYLERGVQEHAGIGSTAETLVGQRKNFLRPP